MKETAIVPLSIMAFVFIIFLSGGCDIGITGPDQVDKPIPVSGVSLDRTNLYLPEGSSRQLKAVVFPEDATDKSVNWNSSNKNVVTVDDYGNITAHAAGPALITVTTNEGGYYAECDVAVSETASGDYIIADHMSVDAYEDIPQEYIDIVKTWLVDAAGQSHSEAYRTGLLDLEKLDDVFEATTYYGVFPAPTGEELRVGRHDSVGEEEFWTNGTAISTIKDLIADQHDAGNPIHVIFQAWCWDLTWDEGPAEGGTDSYDPVYGCHWFGGSEEGPDGNHIWGIDDDDYELTGNTVSLQTYLDTIEEYNAFCQNNGYITKAIFSTGPVDGDADDGERGYQRWVKHEVIRDFVREGNDRVLFDYADILAYNDAGERHMEDWTSPETSETYEFPAIHSNNDAEDTGHISNAGALRLAKAQWWLYARMAGWDGNPE